MPTISRQVGSTSNIIPIFIQNSSLTTGAGLTGLVFNSSGLTGYYKRNKGTASVAITLATITTLGTYATGGLKEVDSANMPGEYEFHPPDTAFASGADSVSFLLKGATNMAPCRILVELTATSNQDAVHGGMTAIPNAVAGASGGLLISGSNAGTTTLGALTVTGATTLTGNVAAQAGVTITNSTTNGSGLSITGNGTGDGISATGGATGNGAHFLGGGTSGVGLRAEGAAGNSQGVQVLGQGSAAGLTVTGGATGAGVTIAGGGTSGAGVSITTTSGDGLSVAPTAGHAIIATANGTAKHAMFLTSGALGVSDALSCVVAGGTGVPIRGNITGNLSGTVTTTTSVTNAVTVTGTPAVNVTQWNTASVATPNVAGVPKVDVVDWLGSAPAILDASGFVKANTQATAASLTYNLTGSVSSVSGAVNSVTTAVVLPANPPSGFLVTASYGTAPAWYSAPPTPPTTTAIATAVWQDATAGDFTTASSIGQRLTTGIPNIAPGATNGLFIAGTNAATTVTTALTTTFTGNLTGNVGGSVGSVTGAVGSVTGNVGGNVTGTVGSVVTKTGYTLAAAGLDSVIIDGNPTTLNARQALAICSAAVAGKASGAPAPGPILFQAINDAATNRISATVDANGNRTAVTLTPPV